MRKDYLVNVSLDGEAVRLLAAIAEQETEGNRSAAMRKVVREAAKERGIAVPFGKGPNEEVDGER